MHWTNDLSKIAEGYTHLSPSVQLMLGVCGLLLLLGIIALFTSVAFLFGRGSKLTPSK